MDQAGSELSNFINVEVARHGLSAIAEEMAISHVRAAYSSVVRDMLDFSTAVCDGQGRVVAQGLSLALQLGAIPRFMQLLTAHVEKFEPGDVWLVNHPWKGGVHLPDFFFARPIFIDGYEGPAGFSVIVSHMIDVGGRFPGGVSVLTTSIFEEGLIIPPVPLVKNGLLNQPVLDIIAANSRQPVTVVGDIRAVQAGLETGARQFLALAERMGGQALLRAIDTLLVTTERATRAAIAALPDGTARAEDILDHGRPEIAQQIVCTVTKKGDRLHFDYTGTAPQLMAGNNCNYSDMISVIAFATRSVLTEDIPANDGFYRCLDFIAPEGSLLNAQFPAAVSSRGSSMYRICDVAMNALAKLMPERVIATPGGTGVIFISGTWPDGKPFLFLDLVLSGWGARADGDGAAGLSPPLMNAANIPVEVIEQSIPVRIHEFGLAPNTGGAGEFMGAPGVVRDYEFLADGTEVNLRLERNTHAPLGLDGGAPGMLAEAKIRRAGGDWEIIPATGRYVLNKGDRLRGRLSGSGGVGDPARRDPAASARDRASGLVTA